VEVPRSARKFEGRASSERLLDQCSDPQENADALARICASLRHDHVRAYFDRWKRALPSPFTEAERSRYGYGLSVRQLEISETRVFDRPAAGRAWFERMIADQLSIGRPDKVAIVFDRKDHQPHPRRLSDQGHHAWRSAGHPGALQALQGQAVLQRGPRATDRDDRQRPV